MPKDNFLREAVLELISDEREWSDDQNKNQNAESAKDETGYEKLIPTHSAHSSRSRHMLYEYNHQWDS